MNLNDYQNEQVVDGKTVNTEIDEIVAEPGKVIDLRKAAN